MRTDPQSDFAHALSERGLKLREEASAMISSWQLARNNGQDLGFDITEAVDDLELHIEHWFNEVNAITRNSLTHDQEFLASSLHYIKKAVRAVVMRKRTNDQKTPLTDAEVSKVITSVQARFDGAIRDLQTVPSLPKQTAGSDPPAFTIQPNSAFILMWMNPEKSELEDISNTFKEVFADFGIQANRADDIEHEGVITDVILRHIRESEFLIADLSGQRPNVYYEVGYAHAIGKRPILYRKQGTPLHFDLSVHNVPEYSNLTHLKTLLRKRLEAMTGKQPK